MDARGTMSSVISALAISRCRGYVPPVSASGVQPLVGMVSDRLAAPLACLLSRRISSSWVTRPAGAEMETSISSEMMMTSGRLQVPGENPAR